MVLKEVFDSILLFEKTGCPFERSFTVALPERPLTPIKKKPWTSVGKKLIKSPFLTELSPSLPAAELVSKKRRSTTLTNGIGRQLENRISEAQTSNAHPPATANRTGTANSLLGPEGATTTGEDGKRLGQEVGLVVLREEAPDVGNVLSQAIHQEQKILPDASGVTTIPKSHYESDNESNTHGGNDAGLKQVPSEAASNFEDDITHVNDSEATGPVMGSQKEVITLEGPQHADQAQRFVLDTVEAIARPFVFATPTMHTETKTKPDTPIIQGCQTTEVKSAAREATAAFLAQGALTVPSISPPFSEHVSIPSQSGSLGEKEANLQSTKEDANNATDDISSKLATLDRIQQNNAENPSTLVVCGESNADKAETYKVQGAEEPHSFEGAGSIGAISLKKKRMSRMLAGRSVNIPPQLTLVTSSPDLTTPLATAFVQATDLGELLIEEVAEEASPIESVDSFHSIQSWHSPTTPLPPSPPSSSSSPAMFPYPHENIVIPAKGLRTARSANFTPITDDTFVPSSTRATSHALYMDSPADLSTYNEDVKSLNADLLQSIEATSRSTALPEHPGLQDRSRTTNLSISRRALSSLPPVANLFSPVRKRHVNRLAVVRNLPGAIINKTVEILLSPPGHLVNLMLKVAAKIAAGEWRGLVFGMGEGGESIPVHWDYSDGELSSWEDDDDYKFSIGRLTKTQSSSSSAPKEQVDPLLAPPVAEGENDRSWEVD